MRVEKLVPSFHTMLGSFCVDMVMLDARCCKDLSEWKVDSRPTVNHGRKSCADCVRVAGWSSRERRWWHSYRKVKR